MVGFDAENIAQLDDILAFFRASHLRFYLDMDPISLRENLAGQLIERGFCPAPNGPFLYGLPSVSSHEAQATDIKVRETRDVDLFLELWAESFEFPRDSFTNTLKDLKRGPFFLPENHLYIAYVKGMPAAIGALYIKDGIGHINAGGTIARLSQTRLSYGPDNT